MSIAPNTPSTPATRTAILPAPKLRGLAAPLDPLDDGLADGLGREFALTLLLDVGTGLVLLGVIDVTTLLALLALLVMVDLVSEDCERALSNQQSCPPVR